MSKSTISSSEIIGLKTLLDTSMANQSEFIRILTRDPFSYDVIKFEFQSEGFLGLLNNRIFTTDPNQKFTPSVINDFITSIHRIVFNNEANALNALWIPEDKLTEIATELKSILADNKGMLITLPAMQPLYLKLAQQDQGSSVATEEASYAHTDVTCSGSQESHEYKGNNDDN